MIKKTGAETAYKKVELPKHDWQNPHSSKNPDITVQHTELKS